MLNNKDTTVQQLVALGFSLDEAKLYLELLREPASHLELSRKTGINRTKVYRLADQLEKRSLVTTQTDDSGTFLVAADPSTLEVQLVTDEERLKLQRQTFKTVLPDLNDIRVKSHGPDDFIVATYEGTEGFKQMLWHELKAKSEILVFGNGRLQDLVDNERWAEKHRVLSIEAGYLIRELLNPQTKPYIFTTNQDFMDKIYREREVDPAIMKMDQQVAIYNDTVATYNWRDGSKVGYEVVNRANAQMMRQIFEHYWELAGPHARVANKS